MNNSNNLSADRMFYSLQDLKNQGFSQYRIRRMADTGKLKKLNRFYYENTGYEGEESDFYYAEAYAPSGVICLLSAAVHYGLSMYIPDAVDVAIPRKGRISTLPQRPRLNIHYFTDERYSLGIAEVWEGKNNYHIYDIEKTVVDVVYYREKVGIEETKEVLTTYLQRKDRNLNRLLKYAELMKCSKIMKQYLEVLI